MTDPALIESLAVMSPRRAQAQVLVRKGTNDGATLHSTMWAPGNVTLHDEYGLADVRIGAGEWALDIGAHIGSVALALVMDNPGAHVIAVEPVPENVDMLHRNAAAVGATDRLHVVAAAVGAEGQSETTLHYGHYDVPGIPPEHAAEVRYIGNLFREHGPRGLDVTVPVVSLSGLLDTFGVEDVAFCKIDCEGGEWAFLASPARDRLRVIVGEWHDRPASEMVALLSDTHRVDILHDEGGIGLFRAERR